MQKKWNRLLALTLIAAMAMSGCAYKSTATQPIKYSLSQDYYDYINGELLDGIDIPADSNNWSHNYELKKIADASITTILNETIAQRAQYVKGTNQQKIADLYLTAMDTRGRNAARMSGLQYYFNLIQKSTSIDEYMKALAVINRDIAFISLVGINSSIDMADATKYCYLINIADLGPGKETLEDEKQSEIWKKYQAYISAMLQESGYGTKEADKAAKEVFQFQKELAGAALPLDKMWDPSKIYNPYSMEELEPLFSNFDMKKFMNTLEMVDGVPIIITQPTLCKKINEMLIPDNLPLLKAYSTFCLLNATAPYLSTDIRDHYLTYKRAVEGIQEQKSDEMLASELTQNLLSFEVGKLYVERHFKEEDKHQVEAMLADIVDAYGSRINELEWMADETKTAAKKKLETMSVKIGYPDVWPDKYKQSNITSPDAGGVLIDNVLELSKALAKYDREHMTAVVDRTMWIMPPQAVNAYYNPAMNEIVFPAGILQAPYYDRNREYEANWGGIGVVIAHESTHAFDNTGAQYDSNGNFNIWWSDEDCRKFNALQQEVVAYYNNYEGIDGIPVNGAQTLGENIADLGALNCTTSIVGNDPENLKVFFESYANIWAAKYTEEAAKDRLNTDVHAPAKVRVNAGVSSTDGFYIAYPQLKEGDAMYVAPEKRVRIW